MKQDKTDLQKTIEDSQKRQEEISSKYAMEDQEQSPVLFNPLINSFKGRNDEGERVLFEDHR